MKVTYRSNNSGGDWWLSDADWKALEAYGEDHAGYPRDPNRSRSIF